MNAQSPVGCGVGAPVARPLISLISQIRDRLTTSAYTNEAAITHGVVTPILQRLGWDIADPAQLVPEYSVGRGRVDLALIGAGRRPSVFVEVKGVGRNLDGDRQLFEYAFHQGVPLCILTDGREWSFYLPAGQGSYDDRRVYRLQLDDRDPAECERVLRRYLERERICSGDALDAAQTDHRDMAGSRLAKEAIPAAWNELVAGAEDLLIELIADRAEVISGRKPHHGDILKFLEVLTSSCRAAGMPTAKQAEQPRPSFTAEPENTPARTDVGITFSLFGDQRTAASASEALIDILRSLAGRRPDRIAALAEAVKGRKRNHVGRTVAEIYPARPDLARAAEFAPGWLIGLNISNQQKLSILRVACDVFEVTFPGHLLIDLPNAS